MIFISYPMLVGSFNDFFEINYFQLNYIHNYNVYIIILLYIHISILLNKRKKGVVLTRHIN